MARGKNAPGSAIVQVAIRADSVMVSMIDALMATQGYKSRASVLEQSVRDMYNSKFPSYKARPIAMGTGQVTPSNVIRSKQDARALVKSEEANRVREYGQYVCKTFYIKGKPIGDNTTDPNSARCEYKMIKGMRMKDAFTEVRFSDMPFGTGSWNEDTVLRNFVMSQTFPDIKFEELDPEKVKKNIDKELDLLITGVERGEFEHSAIPKPVLKTLIEEAKSRGAKSKLTKVLESWL